jgi:Predicted membrane protein (DUF2306)
MNNSASRALLAVTWLSMTIFGIYVVLFYGGAIPAHTLGDWNDVLPRLYEEGARAGSFAIGAHFLAGAFLLAIGPAQVITGERGNRPTLHRWAGRVYATAAAVAGIGGLAYIAICGTVGGWVMNVGFGIYGAFMVVAAEEAYRHARARRFDQHRAWAIRLVALAVGSWLYRMDYGVWLKLFGGLGHHPKTFDGVFDRIMAFFFYVPNLFVAEAIIRCRSLSTARQAALTGLVITATAFILIATYSFTTKYWGPHIVARVEAL